MLGPRLRHFDELNKITLALEKAAFNSLHRVLGELFVLNHEVVQVIAQIVSTRRAAVAIEHAEEADLGPLDVELGLVLRFQDVENNADAVLIVLPNNALIGVGRVTLNDATLLEGSLGGLVILEEQGLRVQHGWVVPKQKLLHLNELDVGVILQIVIVAYACVRILLGGPCGCRLVVATRVV